MCYWTWQIILLSSNSFWELAQKLFGQITEQYSLYSENSGYLLINANPLKKRIGLGSYVISW